MPVSKEALQVFRTALNQTSAEAVERVVRSARVAGVDLYAEILGDRRRVTFFHAVCGGDFSETVLKGFLNAASDDDMLRRSQDERQNSILHLAVLNEDCIHWERKIRMILSHTSGGRLLELPNGRGFTPAMYAAIQGFNGVLQLLLDAGANVLAVDLRGLTAFHVAVVGEHWSTCRLLLDHDIHLLDSRDFRQRTALFYANFEGAQLLIERGASLVAAARNGCTALDFAFLGNDLQVVALISSSYAKQVARRQGRFAVHSLLQEATYLIAAQQQTLWVKLKCGTLPISEFCKIVYLLSDGVRDYDYNGSLPIHAAIQTNAPIEVLEALVGAFEAGSTIPNKASLLIPNNDGDLPVHIAAREAFPKTIHWLLEQPEEQHEDVHPALQIRNLRRETPLQSACRGDAPFRNISELLYHDVAALVLPDHKGLLPMHLHLSSTTNSGAVEYWTNFFRKALQVRTKTTPTGMLPFELVAFENSDSVGVLFEVLKRFPDALNDLSNAHAE